MAVRTDARIHVNDLKDRPLTELLRTLANDVSTLVHEEIELGKAELTQKAKTAGIGAGLLVGAWTAALLALGTLTAFLVALLAVEMPVWGAALIVGILWAVGAAVLALNGKRKLQEASPPVPQQTIETTEEDIQWAKTRMQSGSR
jgi:Putative Actinobacterial Holin-X, holin superfamily III